MYHRDVLHLADAPSIESPAGEAACGAWGAIPGIQGQYQNLFFLYKIFVFLWESGGKQVRNPCVYSRPGDRFWQTPNFLLLLGCS